MANNSFRPDVLRNVPAIDDQYIRGACKVIDRTTHAFVKRFQQHSEVIHG